MKNKLNVLLAITDHLAGVFKKGLDEYIKFFKGNQGAFKGERKTYEPRPGTIDQPGHKGNKLVVTTVREKLDYFLEGSAKYIDALFSQEATNASGVAKAHLIVDDKDWGEFSSLELLRLKSLLETASLKEMYESIPVRNDDEIWRVSSNVEHDGREIWESTQTSGVVKTTVKESYILSDPNLMHIDSAKYVPQLGSKDTTVELGDFTHQRYSGEYSHADRAAILNRRSKLLTAVISALKVANEVEVIESSLNSKKIFGYIHFG